MEFEDLTQRTPAPVNRTLTGASAEPQENNGEVQSAGKTATDSLPMVVWLRGDEPHCSEFNLDAEQVMKQLGIKRSRLTQISGREIRVGRIRAGRYIKPLYRQCDIESYRKWTRPTASHLSSARVIKEAAENLKSQSELLVERFEGFGDQISRDLGETTRQETASTQRLAAEQGERTDRKLAQLDTNMKSCEAAIRAMEKRFDDLMKRASLLPGIAAGLADIAAVNEVLTDRVSRNEAAFAEMTWTQEKLVAELAASLEAVESRSAKRLRHLLDEVRRRLPVSSKIKRRRHPRLGTGKSAKRPVHAPAGRRPKPSRKRVLIRRRTVKTGV